MLIGAREGRDAIRKEIGIEIVIRRYKATSLSQTVNNDFSVKLELPMAYVHFCIPVKGSRNSLFV
jgi:hypothetical protein